MGARGVGCPFASIFVLKRSARKLLRKRGGYSKSVDDDREGEGFHVAITKFAFLFREQQDPAL